MKTNIVSIWYNRSKLVNESVASVVNQLTDDMHLILIDDGSSDDTLSKLREFESENTTVVSQSNKGFVRTIKDTVDGLNSEYVAIHGAGDISLPGRFKSQSAHLDEHDDVVVVGCRGNRLTYDGDSFVRSQYGKPGIYDYEQKILTHNLFSHGEVMFRLSAYRQAGGYRTFFTYAQDRDLWCRMSHLGKFSVLNDILYERKAGIKGSVSGDIEKTLVQRMMSSFAIFCHQTRLSEGFDPLERFGENAPLFFRGSKNMRKELRGLQKKQQNTGDSLLNWAVKNEKFYSQSTLKRFATKLFK